MYTFLCRSNVGTIDDAHGGLIYAKIADLTRMAAKLDQMKNNERTTTEPAKQYRSMLMGLMRNHFNYFENELFKSAYFDVLDRLANLKTRGAPVLKVADSRYVLISFKNRFRRSYYVSSNKPTKYSASDILEIAMNGAHVGAGRATEILIKWLEATPNQDEDR